jgi:hypothetical protein
VSREVDLTIPLLLCGGNVQEATPMMGISASLQLKIYILLLPGTVIKVVPMLEPSVFSLL